MTSQPPIFADSNVERLGLAVSALVAEVAVLSERMGAMLALAEERGLFSEAEVEAFRPDDARSQTWQQARQSLIANVFEPFLADRGS